MPPPPTQATPSEDSSASSAAVSPFRLALDEYVRTRPKKSKTPQFILDLQKPGANADQHSVEQAMVQLERDSTDRTAVRNIRKLKPVIKVLSDYSNVLDTLAQADPMPTAIIWGLVKVVIDSSKRFLGLYDAIKSQLTAVHTHLSRLLEYDDLFGHSESMQDLLQASYIDVIRFWVRVDKECNRCVANRAARAFTSFSTSKLDTIITSIGQNADDISKLFPVVQERVLRGERENAAEERRLAGIARGEQSAFIKLHLEDLRLRSIERKRNRKKDVCQWLQGGSQPLNGTNSERQDWNTKHHSAGTCSWLSSNKPFQDWVNLQTPLSKVWLRAAAGVGKSFLCAYAVQQIAVINPTAFSVFQYYSFDNDFKALGVYRCLAEQLVDQLWTQLEDMPEDIHAHTQRSSASYKLEDVKTLIRMLLDKRSATYIFLDGLDEQCDSDQQRIELSEVLNFLSELTTDGSRCVRLWCSSQERAYLKSALSNFSVIEVSKEHIYDDIKLHLSKRILELDRLELDKGYQNLILSDLSEKADGCFLWASLMLGWISKAATLDTVQELIREGLPSDYEKYYEKKIESIDVSQRALVSKLLTCIVHAKRPLRLEELCEATALLGLSDGQDLIKSQVLLRKQVEALCEPLAQVKVVEGVQGSFLVCTLTHATVRNYLIKNPEVLSSNTPNACPITSAAMANVCLSYLSQPRYQRLLVCKGDTFVNPAGEDVMEHHLLSYAAKYWDRHLDDVSYTVKWCERVKQFLASPQFQTCLQVQSLLVGGQFSFWLSAYRPWIGPNLRRVFPSWLSENCGEAMERDYFYFVGEWGNLLDRVTNVTGKYPGEIDRCFWGALGSHNFLQGCRSRYKSFMFIENENNQVGRKSARYYDGVDRAGNYLVTVELESLSGGLQDLHFRCNQWCLKGRRPKIELTQTLKASLSTWSLYDYPVSSKMPGRPAPVSLTSDLKFLRIGSQIFIRSNQGYIPLKVLDSERDYFEEMASNDDYIAVSTRQTVSREDLYNVQLGDGEVLDFGEFLARQLEERAKSKDQSAISSTAVASIEDSRTKTSRSSLSSNNTSVSSLIVEEKDDIVESLTKFQNDSDLDLQDDSTSEVSWGQNSAETAWSEGSTDHLSGEDEDQWNDWGSDSVGSKDLELEAVTDLDTPHSDGEVASQSSDGSDDGDEISDSSAEHSMQISGVSGLKFLLHRRRQKQQRSRQPHGESSNSSETSYSPSFTSASDSQDDSDYENEDGRRLDELIFGSRARKSDGARRATIRIYNTSSEEPQLIFHFSQLVLRPLFDSAPAFHPSEPLVVWPLGSGEILFANIETNTYFTRQLCFSRQHSCHLSVKTHFSTDGQHLHFAALEAQVTEDTNVKADNRQVLLYLQVSTHRLSLHKTARSPPRLLFRTSVSLGRASSISVSSLPYTFTWTPKELYVTTRGETLNVCRIPLFRQTLDNSVSSICYGQKEIFLPRTAASRNVYYFPPPQGAKRGKEDQATVIIGSHSSIPSQGLVVPKYQASLPIGFYLSENSDLGGWGCRAAPKELGGRKKENRAGGRLQGKFEKFDLTEDCDIVPYLF